MAANSLDLSAYSPDTLASQISTTYDEWKDSRVAAEARWEEVRNFVFATSTKETTNNGVGGFSPDDDAKQGWSHSTHLPKITQIYDNLAANYMMAMFSRDKWIEFTGYDKQSHFSEKKLKAEAYIITKCRINGFRREIEKCIADWEQTGNCFARVEFVRELSQDPLTQQYIPSYVGPVIRRISPYDLVFNHLADSFEESPKILCFYKSMGELIREAEERPALKYNKEIIKKLVDLRVSVNTASSPNYYNKLKHIQVQGYGSPWEYLKSGVVEILEFYGDIYNYATKEFLKNRVITVVDRTWIVRNEPILSYNGRPPIYHCGWRERPESLWAMGPLENLVGMQYLINHLQNTKADAFDEFVVPSVFTAGDIEEEGEKFGGLLAQRYHSDSADGKVEFLRPDASFMQSNMEIQMLEALMEAYAGSPREAMGIRTPGEKTAFEIQSLQNAASRIFENKTNKFSVFVEGLTNGMLEQSKIYLDSKDVVQTTNDELGDVVFLEITKEDLTSNGKLVPIGSRHFAEQARIAAGLQAMNQVLQPEERVHISSVDVARAFINVAGLEEMVTVTPNIRLAEQAQSQMVNNELQNQVAAVDTVDMGDQNAP